MEVTFFFFLYEEEGGGGSEDRGFLSWDLQRVEC